MFYKSKKVKASVAFLILVFSISILILCSFGVDISYIVASRYKLQKITEQVACEYAGAVSTRTAISTEDKTKKAQADANRIRKINRVYDQVYRNPGTGLINFRIANARFKADRVSQKVGVAVHTTSQVVPVFLRYVGIKKIVLNANAYAVADSVRMDSSSSDPSKFNCSDTYGSSSPCGNMPAFVRNAYNGGAKYNLEMNYTLPGGGVITAKSVDQDDLQIRLSDPADTTNNPADTTNNPAGTTNNPAGTTNSGSFFIYARYNDGVHATGRWVDIANLVNKEISPAAYKKVCITGSVGENTWALRRFPHNNDKFHNPGIKYCGLMVNVNSFGTPVTFNLEKAFSESDPKPSISETGGFTTMVNEIKIVRFPKVTQNDGSTDVGTSVITSSWGNYEYDTLGRTKDTSGNVYNAKSISNLGFEVIALNVVKLSTKSAYNGVIARKKGADDNISGNLPTGY